MLESGQGDILRAKIHNMIFSCQKAASAISEVWNSSDIFHFNFDIYVACREYIYIPKTIFSLPNIKSDMDFWYEMALLMTYPRPAVSLSGIPRAINIQFDLYHYLQYLYEDKIFIEQTSLQKILMYVQELEF